MKRFSTIALSVSMCLLTLSCERSTADTSISDKSETSTVSSNAYLQKSGSKEIDFTPTELDKLVFELKHNVSSINKLGFYEFSIINNINYKVVQVVQQSNGNREFLLENLKNFTYVEQNEALFLFDLTTKIINQEFAVGTENSHLIGKRSFTWRCAQALAMSSAVTIGAIGITAGSGGAGLGLALFIIGKAYSIQDIVENCS